MPGDDLPGLAAFATTHATTIDAEPSDVWGWGLWALFAG